MKKLFNLFGDVEISRYRMGEYFDYAPYRTKRVPKFLNNIIKLFTLEKIMGENLIIKSIKTEKKSKYSFVKTLFKP